MGRIVRTANIPDSSYLLSQTPKNIVKDNYWLDQLQEKVNYDWRFIPNRVDIEEERTRGELDYSPLEVVIESVKNENGDSISDDFKKIVFRDIGKRVELGMKYRFSYKFDLSEPDNEKNVWLVTNTNSSSLDANCVLTRCNGTIWSEYTATGGIIKTHEEPIYQTHRLETTAFKYNETLVSDQAGFYGIVQHNKYTRQYYINQRFIIGYDQVYRIEAISKLYANKTYQPENVGYMILYFKKVEKSELDNFETRLAYNKVEGAREQQEIVGEYNIRFIEPIELPSQLTSVPISFRVGLFNGDTEVEYTNAFTIECEIGAANPAKYYTMDVTGNNTFVLKRLKMYSGGPLKVKCSIPANASPNGEELSTSIKLGMRSLE